MIRQLAAIAAFVAIAASAHGESFFATEVVSTSVGAVQSSMFADPSYALGGPRGEGATGGSVHVYNLGIGGSITLAFDAPGRQRFITDGPGPDFIVFENAFYAYGEPTLSFAELAFVEVSSNGIDFARFPTMSLTPSPVGPYGTIDPANVSGFAGTQPVFANVDTNTISPFDPAVAGGNAFDLSALAGHPLVQSGAVNLSAVRYLRLVDVHGDGTNLDNAGRPIYDPTGFFAGLGADGFDLDAVAVINGLTVANQWAGPGGGSFNDAAKWTGAIVPTDTAIFGHNIQSPATVTVDQAVSLDAIEFDSPLSYTLTGPSPVALGEHGPASITVLSGSHTIVAPLQLLGDVTIDASGGVLTLGGPVSWGDGMTLAITGGIINFGLPPAPPSQSPADTPEPAALGLLAAALLAMRRCRGGQP